MKINILNRLLAKVRTPDHYIEAAVKYIPTSLFAKWLNKWKNISISRKLIWTFFIGTVLPLIIVTETSFQIFSKNVQARLTNSLITLSSSKTIQIQTYIDEQILDIIQLSVLNDLIMDMNIYKNIYLSSGLNSTEYRNFDNNRGIKYKKYIDRAGYYDMFFISPEGTVYFTVVREKDFGINLSDETVSDSGLKKAYVLAKSMLSPSLSSFEYYVISDAPASFIAVPVFFNGKVLGFLAVQLNLGNIFTLITDKTGMGSSGETIILKKSGPDIYIADWQKASSVKNLFQKLNLLLQKDGSIYNPLSRNSLKQPDKELFIRAASGNHGTGIFTDQKGHEVLAVWQYLPALKWGMIVKQDTKEIFSEAYKIRQTGYIITIIALLIGSLLTFLLSLGIVSPVNELTRAASQITFGKFDINIKRDRNDEIGALAKAFDVMRVWLQTTLNELSDVNTNMRQQAKELVESKKNLESKVIERTKELTMAAKVFENAQEAIVITNKDNRITDINPFYTKLMGYTREEVLGKTPSIVKSGYHDDNFYHEMWKSINETGVWSGEIWDRRKSGEIFPKWLSISSIKDENGEVTHYLGIFSDISLQKETEQKLEQMAYYDPLTDLPNRALFQDRMNQEILHSVRHNGSFAVLFIDLDRFKDINDSMGHNVGDILLIEVANRIKSCVRNVDTVSRIGGDEFTAILSEIPEKEPDHEIVAKIAQSIINVLEEKYIIKGQDVYISASIGISVYPDDGTEFHSLTKNADTAMYQAKATGRSNYKFFTQAMNISITRRLNMENKLRKALNNKEFILMYQPKYNTREKAVVGYEALIRWNHPVDGFISPADFIPLAEESKIIIPIGEWVIDQVCRDLPGLMKPNPLLRIAINLSPGQFKDVNLIEKIDRILTLHKISPKNLEFEITESAIENPEIAIEKMSRLSEKGFLLSIDDFGTGYSSLSYLKKFPINTLKIDKSFIDDIPTSSEDIAITSAIISLARSLSLNIVAEGVETKEQVDFLIEKGCEVIQGYFYSKPKQVKDFL